MSYFYYWQSTGRFLHQAVAGFCSQSYSLSLMNFNESYFVMAIAFWIQPLNGSILTEDNNIYAVHIFLMEPNMTSRILNYCPKNQCKIHIYFIDQSYIDLPCKHNNILNLNISFYRSDRQHWCTENHWIELLSQWYWDKIRSCWKVACCYELCEQNPVESWHTVNNIKEGYGYEVA